jgi:hypothetical protein
MVSSVLTAIRRRWEALGIPVRPGLSEGALRAFEVRYYVDLPAAVSSFYQYMDGMTEGYADDQLICFWPLAAVAPIPVKLAQAHGIPDFGGIRESLPEAASYFVFADHSIWLHLYAVRLSKDAMAPAPVVWIASGNHWELLAPSFSDFVARYANDAADVLFPES